MKRLIHIGTVLLGTLAVCSLASGRSTQVFDGSVAPGSGFGASFCKIPDVDFRSLVSDARPGVKFFTYGAVAFRKGDYQHAIYIYKVAASWADEAAEYDLGLIYFRGEGVPADRPLGTAWMVLAAERGNPFYVHARNLMVTLLTDAEFQRMNELWNGLKKTYGDKVALRRAKAEWARVRSNEMIGSRVGGTAGEIHVFSPNGLPLVTGSSPYALNRSLWQTDDPYAYHYKGQYSDCPSGSVKVGPLQELKAGGSGAPASSVQPIGSGNPPPDP